MLNSKQIILVITVCANQLLWSMNIGGDLTPIKITTEKYYQKELLSVPGNVSSEFEKTKKQDEDCGVINNLIFVNSPILVNITRHLLGCELPNAGGAFLTYSKHFSANKYLQYMNVFAEHLKKSSCTMEELVAFLDIYLKTNNEKIYFFDCCKYLKVKYYEKQYKKNGFYSIEGFAYLKKLDKKYIGHLKYVQVKVENNELEIAKASIKANPLYFTIVALFTLRGSQITFEHPTFANLVLDCFCVVGGYVGSRIADFGQNTHLYRTINL